MKMKVFEFFFYSEIFFYSEQVQLFISLTKVHILSVTDRMV
jgi:hypothetical protein